MKQLQNVLFITTQGTYLCREGEALLVRLEKQTRLRVPIHTIAGVIAFGRIGISTGAMDLCGRNAVPISLLTERGRFIARIEGPVSGNVLLRRAHYRAADHPAAAARIAAALVAAKLANSRTVLLRMIRDHPDHEGVPAIQIVERRLLTLLGDLRDPPPLDQIRGIEGEAGRAYFSVLNHLITAQKDEFYFFTRTRRPPQDNMNALLSFLYTLLAHDVAAALQSVGLDPAVGFLHRDRPGRPGLALDLMEELRAFLADRLALSLVNLRQIQGPGFRTTETGGVIMDDATRKEVLIAWQKRKQEELTHPFLGERMTLALLLPIQALLLARHLRGDLDTYPPFIWK